jgi:hypothetical protein
MLEAGMLEDAAPVKSAARFDGVVGALIISGAVSVCFCGN